MSGQEIPVIPGETYLSGGELITANAIVAMKISTDAMRVATGLAGYSVSKRMNHWGAPMPPAPTRCRYCGTIRTTHARCQSCGAPA